MKLRDILNFLNPLAGLKLHVDYASFLFLIDENESQLSNFTITTEVSDSQPFL